MKKYLKHLSIACLLFIGTSATAAPTQKSVTIGIVLPVAVPALTQIVNGFEETMTQQSKVPVHYSVKNAEGDASMQRSILQEFANDSDVTLVAPIGTDAAQMAIAVVRNKPIVAIAADHVKSEAQKANNLNVTGVNSRVPPAKRMQLIHAAIPSLKKITIMYTASSRIFNQVKEFEAVAKTKNIAVQPLMVSQLSDLYTVSKNIAPNSQAIFILKDELIVSGLNTLLQQAKLKHLPVIASDDGSVANGAAFALGISEKQTGVDAAKIALQVLNGKPARDIPIYMMKTPYVFLNSSAATEQGLSVEKIKQAAKLHHYKINMM